MFLSVIVSVLLSSQITLQQAIEIALSENASVKVADMEVQRAQYAKKGSYAALFPQIDFAGSFQRTIEKQVMYMDGDGFDIGSMLGAYLAPLYAMHGITMPTGGGEAEKPASAGSEGFSVGRWNTFMGATSAQMPLVNAQLWEALKISGQDVELAVEKARGSRLETVTQVKQAYFGALLAKEAYDVYKSVYDNAEANYKLTLMKYEAQKASDLDVARAATSLANAVPGVFDAESSVNVALWRLKAVIGVDLDADFDVCGTLEEYAGTMGSLVAADEDLSSNTTVRQLALQAEQLAANVKAQQYAPLPSLGLAFTYSINAMTNDFNFSEYKWTPYSYVGISLNIPIFAGGKRASNIKVAKIQAAELDVQSVNTEKQLRIQIRQYVSQMTTAMKSHDAAAKALDSARKAYDITAESYAVGSATFNDLDNAQLALTQARLTDTQSVYNYLTSKASLEQVLGKEE